MVDVLLILDGASEPVADGRPTSLERARTPALDALARGGALTRVRTVPAGLPAGSEAAIPVLLGWTPPARVDRGLVEAAAHAIDVPVGARAWRIDVRGADGARAGAAATARAAAALARDVTRSPAHGAGGAAAYAVHALAGHRLLLVGPAPLPAAARAPGLHAWPEGIAVPRRLDASTVVVAAAGAAAGLARLLGAAVVVPAGATGGPSSDLAAKTVAARDAIAAGAARVVVHVGGPDEAAHVRDAAAKVAVLERADRDVVGPLLAAVRDAGGTLRVCPDHGCDPVTGRHDGAPVPCVTWPAAPGAAADEGARLTERAVAARPLVDATRAEPVAA